METKLTFPLIAAALLVAGCTPPNGTAGLAIEATSNSLDAGTGSELSFTDDAGTTWHADLALLRVREIELHLPAGVTCADIQADLVGARCEAEDHASGSDDGGTDNHGGNSGNDDGGTSGNGSIDDNGGTADHHGGRDTPDDSQHALRAGGTDDNPHAEGAAKLEIRGPFLVDLINRTTTPSLTDVRVPALAYSRLEIRLEDDNRALPNATLGDNAFALHATSDAGATLNLQVRANEEIRLESPGGIQVDPGSDLLVLLDAANWLTGVPLAACASDPAAMQIDDDSDCARAIEDRLERSASLHSR